VRIGDPLLSPEPEHLLDLRADVFLRHLLKSLGDAPDVDDGGDASEAAFRRAEDRTIVRRPGVFS
jgi:hypothetical protein